jgi:CheY-like chemotaxis protein
MDDVSPSDIVLERLGMAAAPPALLRIPSDFPVIVLTAHAMAGDKERFLSLGMDYYLSKPIIATELAVVLHQVGMLLRASREK